MPKPIDMPPEVARRFVADMLAYFAEPNAIKRDEIAARQLHATLPPLGHLNIPCPPDHQNRDAQDHEANDFPCPEVRNNLLHLLAGPSQQHKPHREENDAYDCKPEFHVRSHLIARL
jgi:hypothetical protein